VTMTNGTSDDVMLRGLVERIDEGVAVVFVGENEEEWFFPAHVFPRGTAAGNRVWLQRVNGRYNVVGSKPNRPNPDVRGFAERINRLRAARPRSASSEAHDPNV